MKSKTEKEFGSSLKLVAKSSLIVFIGLLISKILAYGYRIIIARGMGAEIYGLFSIGLMVSGWLIAISMLGITQGLVRYIAIFRGEGKEEKIKYLLRYCSGVLLVSSILAGILLFFTSETLAINVFEDKNLIIFFKTFSFLIPFSVMSSVYLAVIRAYEKIGWHSFILNIWQNIMKVLVLILLVYLGFKAKAVAYSWVLGILAMFLFAYFLSRKKIKQAFGKSIISVKERSRIKKEIFRYSLPIMFFSILSTIMLWLDTFFVGLFKTSLEVGLYNAAIPIAFLLSIAPEIFMQLFLPLITREYGKGRLKVIKELAQQVGKWIFILNTPIFVLVILFPGAALNILFGSQYLVAENALRILAIGAFVMSLGNVSEQLIYMIGKSKLFIYNVLIAILINATLNYFLVPMKQIGFIENSLGINGAALATAISMIFLTSLLIFEGKYYLKIVPLRRKMGLIVLAAIIPGILLAYISLIIKINMLSLILSVVLFLITYLVLIFLIGGFDKNDWKIIKAIKNKIK